MTSRNKLELLKRRHKGKSKLDVYKKTFSLFSDSQWIDLEEMDNVLQKLRSISLKVENEFLQDSNIFIESKLLREVYLRTQDSLSSYIFINDYEYCGLFLVNSKEAITNAFDVARKAKDHTCFILDENYNYFFRINYYDEKHNDFPNHFDIQKSFKI